MFILLGIQPGTEVIQVTANDRDLKPALTYNFSEDGNPGIAFSIDRYSGRIAVAKDLDYEAQSTYKLKVIASDIEHEAQTDIIVQLIDENDNHPQFSQQSYQVSSSTVLTTIILSQFVTPQFSQQSYQVSLFIHSSHNNHIRSVCSFTVLTTIISGQFVHPQFSQQSYQVSL